MRTVRELIERHSDKDSEFRYYIKIIDEAEKNEIEHPDITIECCASLFQGVSKSIVHRLDANCDKKAFERLSLQQQVKAACRCLSQSDETFEIAFPVAVENLVRIAGELRNERGDISHGRAVPKELQSDRSLSRLVLVVAESLLRYMLATFFAVKPEVTADISYDDDPDFNNFLDEVNPLDGKPLYSLALFQQYPDDYRIQLDEFQAIDESDELEE